MYKFSIGQPLIVVRDDAAGGFFQNAVGEVQRRGHLIGRKIYEMHFSQFTGVPCRDCGRKHMHRAVFPEENLRPLQDPDEADADVTEQELDHAT